MNIQIRYNLYTLIHFITVVLLFSCVDNRITLNVNEIIDADSILYIRCHTDSVIENTYYSSKKRDSIVINDDMYIKKIVNILREHTDKSIIKHPMICNYLVFYVGNKRYIVGIWRKGVSYNGEYKCDTDLVNYIDNMPNSNVNQESEI